MLNKIKGFIQSAKYHKSLKFIFVVAIIAAIPLTVLIALKQQDIRQRAEGGIPPPYPPANIVLKFSPAYGTYKLGDNFNVQVLVESGSEKITGVNFTLTYNSSIFTLASFTPSSESAFLDSTLINKIGQGAFNYAAVNTKGQQNQYNYFSLGTLNFKSIAIGQGAVGFSEVQITALGQANALSYSNTPSTYTILNEISPTAAVSPTCTPRPACVDITPPGHPCLLPVPQGGWCAANPTPTTSKVIGDINGDSFVDILDYNIWSDEFRGVLQTKQSDLNKDGKVDLLDFNIWRNAFNPTTPTPISAAKYVFITSTLYNGNLGGLIGADSKCQADANSGKLGGTWKAWLSDNTVSAGTRITNHDGIYKTLDGTVVANNWNDLTDGFLQNTINITEKNTVSNPAVWTNTEFDGKIKGTNTCENWTSSTASPIGSVGLAGVKNVPWTDYSTGMQCSVNNALYCFQQ